MDKRSLTKAKKRGRASSITIFDVIEMDITEDISGGFSISCPFDCKILDVFVNCTTPDAAGGYAVTDGTNSITDAMECTTQDANVRAATIDSTYSTLSKGDTIAVLANGRDERGTIYLIVKRI